MSKIKIESKISSNNYKELLTSCYGIKNDNLITYKDSSAFINILLSKNSISIKRENKEFLLELKFKKDSKQHGNYFIKDIKLNFDVYTKTKKLTINSNKIIVEYELYLKDELSDVFVYTIEWSDYNES